MKGLIQGPGFPFVAPFALFMGLLYVRQNFPEQSWWLYGACSLVVLGLILWLRPRYRGQDLAPPQILSSALLGLGAIVLWIGLDPWMPRTGGPRDNTFPFEAAFQIGTVPGVLPFFFASLAPCWSCPLSRSFFGVAF